MNETLAEISALLQEIATLLATGARPDARKAIAKLERISALASTSALTLQTRR
jgi:hypothetical protein